MKAADILVSDDGYWTPTYGVYRHNKALCHRPDAYAVICNYEALQLIRLTNPNYRHPACVVDDFGTLVKVPA